MKQQLEHTKAKLESANELELATLTKHDLVGDLLYGTVISYFSLNDLQDQIAAQSANVLSYRLPSYGTFSTNLQTQYWFGLPRNVAFAGLSMDIDHMKQHRIAKNNSKQESIAFSQSIGARMSAMEHLVPEQMFSTEESQAQGISAVKALAIAGAEGQKIWTIDKNNLSLALSRINIGADAKNDIRNAVNAGKIATTHEARINFHGWIGEGYILMDPHTGAGAYMISGGGNGSETKVDGSMESVLTALGILSLIVAIGLDLLSLLSQSRVHQVAAKFISIIGIAINVAQVYSANCPWYYQALAYAAIATLIPLLFLGAATLIGLFALIALIAVLNLVVSYMIVSPIVEECKSGNG